jgi:hypothetical protein
LPPLPSTHLETGVPGLLLLSKRGLTTQVVAARALAPEVDPRGVHHQGAVQPRASRAVGHVHVPLPFLHRQGHAQAALAAADARQPAHLHGTVLKVTDLGHRARKNSLLFCKLGNRAQSSVYLCQLGQRGESVTVRYHCGGWPEEVNSCFLNSYMVYL